MPIRRGDGRLRQPEPLAPPHQRVEDLARVVGERLEPREPAASHRTDDITPMIWTGALASDPCANSSSPGTRRRSRRSPTSCASRSPTAPSSSRSRDVWPRTAKVYCHRAIEWPADPDIVERVPVRVCQRRGAAVDLVLDRARENRSQFVFTKARGRDVIFWQSARTTKQARPNVAVPTARAAGRQLEILVDSHERYPWTFNHQQATTERRALPAGDYAVSLDGAIVAAVERKSLADLVSTMTSGKLRYLLADLAAVPNAAVVVEDRYSAVFKLDHVRPAIVAEGLGEAAARFPSVPIVFAETRPLAQEWTYRFLGAALAHLHDDRDATSLVADLPPAGEVAAAGTDDGRGQGMGPRGRPGRLGARPPATRDLDRVPRRQPVTRRGGR